MSILTQISSRHAKDQLIQRTQRGWPSQLIYFDAERSIWLYTRSVENAAAETMDKTCNNFQHNFISSNF